MDNNTLENGIVVQPCEWGVVGVERKWLAPEDNVERGAGSGIEVTPKRQNCWRCSIRRYHPPRTCRQQRGDH
jgi:hypothetical protein